MRHEPELPPGNPDCAICTRRVRSVEMRSLDGYQKLVCASCMGGFRKKRALKRAVKEAKR